MLDMETMSARLALDLDHDAIRLLSHQTDGWVVEGVAELDSADLTQKIAGLHQRAEDLGGPDPAVLLVLPRSQVLYVAFDGVEDPESEIAERLDGQTPYDLHEITWDHATVDGHTLVAAVALETIDEALAFASASRFRVVGVTSEPPEGEFPRLPVFQGGRAETAERPLLLEPAEPPERAAVAFSEQRDVEYTPARAPITAAAAMRTRNASAALADRTRAFLSFVPKPLLGAVAVGGAVIVAAALWPERDPDPFTKRNVDLSFAALPAASMQGLTPPDAGRAPMSLAGLEPVTVLRDPPAIVVPIIVGASRIKADYSADTPVEEAFERIAAVPALYGETLLPAPEAGRPAVFARPEFPQAEAPGTSRFARADTPAPLAPPPAVTTGPTVAAVAPREIPRLAGSLPTAAAMPAPPEAAAPVDPPALVATAPAPAASPSEGQSPAAPPAPSDSEPGPPVGFASLPPVSRLVVPLPDASMALLPPAADERFEIGPDGFVVATPEGTETPDGAIAIAGAPPLVAPPRPGTAVESEVTTGTIVVDEPAETAPVAAIAAARVNPNPGLVSFPPRPRPAMAAAGPIVAALPALQVPDDLIAEALAAPEDAAPAEPVLTISLVPRPRPDRPAPAVQTATAASAAPAAPRIPSRASVAREATIENVLALNRLNLIGVYGSASDRRALVRLPTGRFVKLKVGDRLDGGQVAQIGPDRLLYQKGSRTLALEMPNT